MGELLGEIVEREEAEKLIRESIEDYLSIETLQQIIDVIYGTGEIVVVEDNEYEEEE
jgi:hypothetical protein